MKALRGLFTIAAGLMMLPAMAQEPGGTVVSHPMNWHMLDHESSGYWGASVNRVYNTIDIPAKDTIIVAVIDVGVQIDHPDLKEVIWTNSDEIAGNGKDDDGNGYIDDVNGWSFLGGDSADVHYETKELTRQYRLLKERYSSVSEDTLNSRQEDELQRYYELKNRYNNEVNALNEAYEEFYELAQLYSTAKQYFSNRTGVQEPGYDLVASLEMEQKDTRLLREFYLYALENDLEEGLVKSESYFTQELEYSYNVDYNPRYLVGDDADDPTQRFYGNNHVEGPEAAHGTHVAGIIAAQRGNAVGMDGIADAVRIMPVRAVPLGDERDKDVANAIRYAVDNGARIINMSFSKPISPHEKIVEEAIAHAAKNGVLFVHAAGNDAADLGEIRKYPDEEFEHVDKVKDLAWLEVGAHYTREDGSYEIAGFSNYGRKELDIFAPGIDLYSAVPVDAYEKLSGTSMAAPVVSGVAALVWSRYPELPAGELREILIDSATDLRKVRVRVPGAPDKVKKLKRLSKNAGALNAHSAMEMAGEWSNSQ